MKTLTRLRPPSDPPAVLPPLVHAYALDQDHVIKPGMVAYCGHVRTPEEGRRQPDMSEPAAMCEVCRAMYPKRVI